MPAQAPDITLYFLAGSRAIRIAWLLEELQLPYKLISSPRAANGHAPPEFKAQIPTRLGNSPTIKDGDLVIQESGPIIEYLCHTYDTSRRLMPQQLKERLKVKEWMAAAEGTFLLHALAIYYPRMKMPQGGREHLPALEERLAPNVRFNLDALEAELGESESESESEGAFLVGKSLTAADVMMCLSIESIFVLGTGTGGLKWPSIERWLNGLMERDAYKRAVRRTGYSLG